VGTASSRSFGRPLPERARRTQTSATSPAVSSVDDPGTESAPRPPEAEGDAPTSFAAVALPRRIVAHRAFNPVLVAFGTAFIISLQQWTRHRMPWAFSAWFFVCILMVLAAVVLRWWRAEGKRVAVSASRGGLRIGDATWIPRAAITSASVTVQDAKAMVTVRGRHHVYQFRMETADDAEALIARLALRPAEHAFVFPLGGRLWRWPLNPLWASGLGSAATFLHPAWAQGLFLGGLLAWLLLPFASIWSRKLTIASDGLRIDEGRASAFFAFADVARFELRGSVLVLCLHDGTERTFAIGIGDEPNGGGPAAATIADALRRAHARWQQRRAATTESLPPELLGAAAAGAHYRTPAVARERLFDAAEDAAADVRVRIAAAAALARDADSATKVRLADLAEATASEDLERALRAAHADKA